MYLLLVSSGLMLAQTSKTLVTINGERVKYDQKMTTSQRDALPNKVEGMVIYNTTTKCHEFWDGSGWFNTCWKGKATTGGDSEVSSIDCSVASNGTMKKGDIVSGVSQTISVFVTKTGSYNITAKAHGVTFAASGTFLTTGSQSVTLTATGTPTEAGNLDFELNTIPVCSFVRTVSWDVNPGDVITATGRTWHSKNLGAERVATAINDHRSYGDLYQWGRSGADNHQKINWTSPTSGTPVNPVTTTTLSTTSNPGHSQFIIGDGLTNDWRTTRDNTLWQGVNGLNNPCPTGYRVPTLAEWDHEITLNVIQSGYDSSRSVLKLPAGGSRYRWTGNLGETGKRYAYHSSTVSGNYTKQIHLTDGANPVILIDEARATGAAVRCIKD